MGNVCEWKEDGGKIADVILCLLPPFPAILLTHTFNFIHEFKKECAFLMSLNKHEKKNWKNLSVKKLGARKCKFFLSSWMCRGIGNGNSKCVNFRGIEGNFLIWLVEEKIESNLRQTTQL